MSKYREIKTEYRNLESLKKSLTDLKISYEVAPNWRVPSLPMYGYHADERPEKASIAIRREWVNDHWSCSNEYGRHYPGASNDIGFAWDGKQFTAIVSNYDSGRQGVTDGLKQLAQRYSYHEVQRLARMNGYTVKSTTSENGQIRVIVQR